MLLELYPNNLPPALKAYHHQSMLETHLTPMLFLWPSNVLLDKVLVKGFTKFIAKGSTSLHHTIL